MVYDREKARQAYLVDRDEQIAYVNNLIQTNEMMDEDGYPTDACLEAISKWHFTDSKGWFNFIREYWHLASWGWTEGEADHEYKENVKVYRYGISTAGWSGNESIIRAMESNTTMWHLNWFQSNRGGHYIFEEYHVQDE
jgi:hypothetical protein